MLYLHCTPQRAKNLNLDLKDPVEPSSSHWLDHWLLTVLAWPERSEKITAFMNVDTKFVLLFSDARQNPVLEVVPEFVERLARFSGYSVQERYGEFVVCEHLSAFEQGLVNDLSARIFKRATGDQLINLERVECLWNQGVVHQNCPFDQFMTFLQDGVALPHQDTNVSFLKIVR